MSGDSFARRAQTLEDAFFHKVDQELISKLQEQHQHEVDEDALSAATGITDRKVLDELLAADVTPSTLTALALFPAVYVAWADGHVEAAERKAVLDAAHSLGINEGTAAHQLLENWLKRKPTSELYAAWKDFVRAASSTLSEASFNEQKDPGIRRSHDITEAAGGFLGVGSVSESEKKTISELESVFADAANG